MTRKYQNGAQKVISSQAYKPMEMVTDDTNKGQ